MTTWLPNAVVDHLRVVATWPELPGDRYVLERPIGRGGMGTVYVARDTLLDRDVAVKVSNAPSPGAGLDQRLRQEAQVLARLEHPGIVPVHDAGLLDDGRLFYVMKLVRGETLAAHISRLQDEAALLGVFERVTETMAFAHTAGVVHRDLKPSNVMVGRFGEVLVLDWGVAKVLATDALAGTRVGTPGFMSPEQARGEGATGTASDVFALGALLFWMLTGEIPTATIDGLIAAIAGGPSAAAVERDGPEVSRARRGLAVRGRGRSRRRSGEVPRRSAGYRASRDGVRALRPLVLQISNVHPARRGISRDARDVRVSPVTPETSGRGSHEQTCAWCTRRRHPRHLRRADRARVGAGNRSRRSSASSSARRSKA